MEWFVWRLSFLKLADLILKKTNPITSRIGWIWARGAKTRTFVGEKKPTELLDQDMSPMTTNKASKEANRTFEEPEKGG